MSFFFLVWSSNIPSAATPAERESELVKTSPVAAPAEGPSDVADEDVAPPKPPLPEAKMAELR